VEDSAHRIGQRWLEGHIRNADAYAVVQPGSPRARGRWIPAFAGMTCREKCESIRRSSPRTRGSTAVATGNALWKICPGFAEAGCGAPYAWVSSRRRAGLLTVSRSAGLGRGQNELRLLQHPHRMNGSEFPSVTATVRHKAGVSNPAQVCRKIVQPLWADATLGANFYSNGVVAKGKARGRIFAIK
jgi:hypothetical protein